MSETIIARPEIVESKSLITTVVIPQNADVPKDDFDHRDQESRYVADRLDKGERFLIFQGSVEPDCQRPIKFIYMVENDKTKVTIDDLKNHGYKVRTTATKANIWVRNAFAFGADTDGKDTLVDNVYKTKSRSRSLVDRVTKMPRQIVGIPANWGEIQVLSPTKAIVGSTQITDLLGLNEEDMPSQEQIIDARQMLKQTFGWEEVVIIGGFGEKRRLEIYDIDLIVTPVDANTVVFCEPVFDDEVEEIDRLAIVKQLEKMRSDLEQNGITIKGNIPFYIDSIDKIIQTVTYNNVLIDQDSEGNTVVLLNNYVGNHIDDSRNRAAHEAWKRLGYKIINISVDSKTATSVRNGGLRCMTAEKRTSG